MQYEFDPCLLLKKLQTQYDAMCLLNVGEDSILQLMFPVSDVSGLREQRVCWSTSLQPIISSIVRQEDQAAVLAFLQPDRVRHAFKEDGGQEEIVFLSQRGHYKKIVLLPFSFRDGYADEVLYLLSDQTLHLTLLKTLQDIGEHDRITHLYNRVKLQHMLETEYSNLRSCGVLFFDINNLKVVNDTQGHATGDALICQVGESIRSIANRSTQSYRYGGDEFLVVTCNGKESDLDDLITLWRSRLDILCAHSGLMASVAVGRAWSEAPVDLPRLIREADQDMYNNKRRMKLETP